MKKILTLGFCSMLLVTASLIAHDHPGKGGHFKKMDVNADNKISKEEWQKFHDAHFTEIDKDADGSLTLDEMKAFHDGKKSEKEEKKEAKKSGKK